MRPVRVWKPTNRHMVRDYHTSRIIRDKDVVEPLHRSVTSNAENLNKLEFSELNMHIYSRWINSLCQKNYDHSVDDFILKQNCNHYNFQSNLGERIIKKINNKELEISSNPFIKDNDPVFDKSTNPLKNFRNMHLNLDVLKMWTHDYSSSDEEQHNFVPGHSKVVEGKTRITKTFVTLYDPNSLEFFNKIKKESKVINWLCPLEQALLYRKLSDYRENLAILKNWDAYSEFALVVIPKNTDVKFRMGLTYPKSFPRINKKTLEKDTSDLNEAKISFNNLKNINNKLELNSIFEYAKGGCIQFQALYAKNHYVIKLPNSLEFKKDIEYSPKISRNIWGNNKYRKNDKEYHHLLDESYDDAELKIHKSLKLLGIINEEEYNEICSIIQQNSLINNGVKGKYIC